MASPKKAKVPAGPGISAEQLAQEVHVGRARYVIVVTGGGSGAIATLLGVPGASRSILAAAVPYAAEALTEWLGGKPDEFCSAKTARAMAMAAFLRAKSYDPQAETCGAACTASLASDRPKRGGHRAHFAFQTASATTVSSVELVKGQRSRAEEEAVVSALLLNGIAVVSGTKGRLEVPLLEVEQVQSERVVAPLEQQDLLAGRTRAVALGAAQREPQPRAVFSGAFHPLHAGHRRMAEIAAQTLGCEVAFEISIVNVDKPPLDFIEIDGRTRQFAPEQAVWLTRAANFTEKAELFPGATFVVGADTIARIAHPRYYGGQQVVVDRAIETIAARGCRFLVFGRAVEGTFRTLADLHIPAALERICQAVPESVFRDDVSSTHLRRQGQSPDAPSPAGDA